MIKKIKRTVTVKDQITASKPTYYLHNASILTPIVMPTTPSKLLQCLKLCILFYKSKENNNSVSHHINTDLSRKLWKPTKGCTVIFNQRCQGFYEIFNHNMTETSPRIQTQLWWWNWL